MRCLALLGFFAWGFGSSAGPSGGASPPPCPASCSCDGDGGVDCSGRGLTAVPEGLSAFTHALNFWCGGFEGDSLHSYRMRAPDEEKEED